MATATKTDTPELSEDTAEPVELTDKERIIRLEKAVNSLAFLETRLAHIPLGAHPELDAIREENFANLALAGAPRQYETRPHKPAETRADRRIGGAAND